MCVFALDFPTSQVNQNLEQENQIHICDKDKDFLALLVNTEQQQCQLVSKPKFRTRNHNIKKKIKKKIDNVHILFPNRSLGNS